MKKFCKTFRGLLMCCNNNKKVNLICQSILIQLQFLVKHLSKTAKILHRNIDAEKFRQISTILFKLYSRQ